MSKHIRRLGLPIWLSGRTSPKPNVTNYLIGDPIPPAPEEMGYKDTVKAPPGYVTRTRAKFDAALDVPPGLQLEDQELRQLGLPLPHTRARGKRHDAAV